MARVIGAVVAGYVVMFAVVFLTFSGAYLAMGTERAFLPGTYEVSSLWLAVSFVFGFVAALIGGCVCRAIARNTKAVVYLAALVIVLGIALAVPVLTAPDAGTPKARPSGRPQHGSNAECAAAGMGGAAQPDYRCRGRHRRRPPEARRRLLARPAQRIRPARGTNRFLPSSASSVNPRHPSGSTGHPAGHLASNRQG